MRRFLALAELLAYTLISTLSAMPRVEGDTTVSGRTTYRSPGLAVSGNRVSIGPTVLQHVATNADLALANIADYASGVWRDDYAAGVGAPPLLYEPQTGDCASHGFANDGGLCTNALSGNSFVARFPAAGIDPREWCAIGTSNDTACFTAIDTAMGLPSWPADVAKTIRLPAGTVYLGHWRPSSASLIGQGKAKSIVRWASGTNPTYELVNYIGTGDWTFADLTLVCPISDPVTRATPDGASALRVGDSVSGGLLQQSENITVHGIRTVGCQNGMSFYGVRDLDVSDTESLLAWNVSWVVSDAGDAAGIHTERVRFRHVYGLNPGQYCGSAPVNATGDTYAVGDMEFLDIGCDGAGAKDNKLCFDIPTGTAVKNVIVRGWGRNCWQGGLESKITSSPPTGADPGNHNIDIDFTFYTAIDNGAGVQLVYESAAGAAGDISDMRGRAYVVYYKAPDRLADTYYAAGRVFAANGNTYKVVRGGTTGSGAGPTGTGTGITDGTGDSGACAPTLWPRAAACAAIVDYLQAAPSAAGNLICAELEGYQRVHLGLTCDSTAFGLMAYARGGAAPVLADADVRLVGTNITGACLLDSNVGTGNVQSLRLIDWSCTGSAGSSYNLIDIGRNTLGAYNLEIIGGSFRQANAASNPDACIQNRGAASFNLQISGGASFQCVNRVLYLKGPSAVDVTGGGAWNLTVSGSSPANAIEAAGAAATGTVEVTGPVRLKSIASPATTAYYPWINSGGAAMAVYGRFLRGFAAAAPTADCASGDVVYAQAPGVGGQPAQGWYCSVAAGSTWAAF